MSASSPLESPAFNYETVVQALQERVRQLINPPLTSLSGTANIGEMVPKFSLFPLTLEVGKQGRFIIGDTVELAV